MRGHVSATLLLLLTAGTSLAQHPTHDHRGGEILPPIVDAAAGIQTEADTVSLDDLEAMAAGWHWRRDRHRSHPAR